MRRVQEIRDFPPLAESRVQFYDVGHGMVAVKCVSGYIKGTRNEIELFRY